MATSLQAKSGMFPQWRIKIHEARLAMEGGRYEDAARMLADESLRDFRQAQDLSREVAKRLAERASKRLAADASSAGWQDVERLQRLNVRDSLVGELREAFALRGCERATELLLAGQPHAAAVVLKKYLHRLDGEPRLTSLHALATSWDEAVRHLNSGDNAECDRALEHGRAAVAGLAADRQRDKLTKGFDAVANDLACRSVAHRAARKQLHDAVAHEDWQQVLVASDQALQSAPDDRVARAAQRKAWHAVGIDATQIYRPQRVAAPQRAAKPARDTDVHLASAQSDTHDGVTPPERYLLWVDAVGGYLVCVDDAVVLGQPSGGAMPAVPLLADLSRRHAVLRRDHGQYVLEPLGPVLVDGRAITSPTVLGNQHEIALGERVRLRFTRPHALSATARLDILSHHKSDPHADGIILLAESCLLGKAPHSHIRCRDWESELLLFRTREGLAVRSSTPLEVDGNGAEGAVVLVPPMRVEGNDFAVSVEPV